MREIYYMSPKIRGTEMYFHQLLTILLSHGFLEIFEKYMSPKIRENIFQSHGSHGFHGFLEIYPNFSGYSDHRLTRRHHLFR